MKYKIGHIVINGAIMLWFCHAAGMPIEASAPFVWLAMLIGHVEGGIDKND